MKIVDVFKRIMRKNLPVFLFLPALVWVGLLLFIPLATMVYDSVWTEGLSGAAYVQFFDLIFVRVILLSILLAGSAATLTLLIGYPVAYFLTMRKTRFENLFIFLLTLPFWTNLIIQVYAWFFILERSGLLNTVLMKLGIINRLIQFGYNIGAIILLMVYCYLPFMVMPIYTTLQKMDKQLLEASMDLGATNWQTFWRITWPLSLSGVRTGFLLVFVPAYGDFVIPSLVGGSRYLTVGSLISYYFLTAQDAVSGAAFTVIAGLVLGCFVIGIQTLLRVQKKSQEHA